MSCDPNFLQNDLNLFGTSYEYIWLLGEIEINILKPFYLFDQVS